LEALVAGTPSWLASGRIPGLDGLRALAVGLVIFAHLSLTQHGAGANGALAHVTVKLGPLGVDVFFVLSGFLITSLLCREQARTDRISLRAFYLRRVLRIVPAYVFFLLFVAVLAASARADVSRPDWVAAGTYTMNFRPRPAWEVGHIWSLSIEEHFYLLWPPILALLTRRAATWAVIGVLAIEPALRWWILLESPAHVELTELWTVTRLDSIAAGCLLALLSRNARGFRMLDAMARSWLLALGAVVLAVAGGLFSGKFSVGIAPTVTALAIAVLVWAAIRYEPRLLETRALVAIGLGSYSLYLWQQVFLNPRRGEWWNTFPQNLVLTGVCAAISYHFIELPFMKMKNRHTT
jgi:peptidoglycan/LPS O-acetylase OafA/YrhL